MDFSRRTVSSGRSNEEDGSPDVVEYGNAETEEEHMFNLLWLPSNPTFDRSLPRGSCALPIAFSSARAAVRGGCGGASDEGWSRDQSRAIVLAFLCGYSIY